jgi:hypothetical protein
VPRERQTLAWDRVSRLYRALSIVFDLPILH